MQQKSIDPFVTLDMNGAMSNVKKPSGCWYHAGCLFTIVSTLLIAFSVYLIFDSEKELDRKRAEYAAYHQEYEEAMKAYEADSANMKAEYQRILAEIDAAQARNDSVAVAALNDSLKCYSEPEWVPRGAIGVNIGAAFIAVFAVAMLVPLAIGILLLVYYRYRKRKWQYEYNLNWKP